MRQVLVLISSSSWLLLALLLGACGGGGGSSSPVAINPAPTVTPAPAATPAPSATPAPAAPTISVTAPATAPVGQSILLAAGAVVVQAPAGLRASGTFLLEISGPGNFSSSQPIDGALVGCVGGTTACSSSAAPVSLGPTATPGVYTIRVTVFDQLGRSAAASASITLI